MPTIDLGRVWTQFVYDEAAPLLFNSGLFLLLFTAFLGGYVLLQRRTGMRVLYVLGFSLFFYYKTSGYYVALLLVSTVVDYLLGLAMGRRATRRERRPFLVLSILANLGMLAFFKYTPFLLENLSGLLDLGLDAEAYVLPFLGLAAGDIFLPIGISFYTFQTLSYAIDVYRGDLEPERNVLHFAFFVSFFPQLVAGPIVRAKQFLPQIRRAPIVTRAMIGSGLLLVLGGLFKKAVISDYIAVNFVDRVFDEPLLYGSFENLMAVYGYALQIYCDFSGYSDMAIGLALLLGFRLPENFRSPYRALSVTAFWRRWHISLSSWLRDYLYIPLGGNRKGRVRTYVNLMLTMLLGGLWHGAAWQFVAWGGLHGAALAAERWGRGLLGGRLRPSLRSAFRPVAWLLTFHFVCLAWVFFRAPSFASGTVMLGHIVGGFSLAEAASVLVGYKAVAVFIVLGYALHAIPEAWEERVAIGFARAPLVAQAAALAAVMWYAIQVATAGVQPFIYFQF